MPYLDVFAAGAPDPRLSSAGSGPGGYERLSWGRAREGRGRGGAQGRSPFPRAAAGRALHGPSQEASRGEAASCSDNVQE